MFTLYVEAPNGMTSESMDAAIDDFDSLEEALERAERIGDGPRVWIERRPASAAPWESGETVWEKS